MANEKRLIKMCDATKVYNGIALYMAENAYLNDTALDVLKMVASWLNEAPTVDAVEVVHGRWERMGEADYKCPVCGFRFTSADPISMFQYCRCGAKMDGDGSIELPKKLEFDEDLSDGGLD